MASKEATAAAAPAAETKKEKKATVETFAFEFKLAKAKIGEKTTNKQVKSKVNEAFMGYGAFDECRVAGDVGADRTVYVFFARLFEKGQPAWDALNKGESPTIQIYDEAVPLSLTGEKPSGGGATTGTSTLAPKKEAGKKEAKKEGGRGRGRGRGEEKGDGKAGPEAKDGDAKEGGRGRGRGRGKKEDEKKESLQRGRANIGGKLGPVSKIRLARIEKAKKEAERKRRLDAGETLEEDEKKEEEPEEPKKAPAKAEKGKAEKGKAEKGKGEAPKGEKGKAEKGKAEKPKGEKPKK